MTFEETLIFGMIDGVYVLINHMNNIQLFGMGLFNWLITFFVAGFVVELLRHLILGGSAKDGN